ncbi:MAG: ECF transporter S component [Gallibacter sp.]|nr:ECF transporter S component [Gallibacter sp.]
MENLRNDKMNLNRLVLAAIMMALVIVSTMIVRIPVIATQGYIHLGDCMVFFSVYVLGKKYGAVVAGVGSAMADLFAGYAVYIPITLVVKFLMALVLGIILERLYRAKASTGNQIMEYVALALSGSIMVLGYYIAESIMYGSFVSTLAAIPMNILQFVVGIVLVKLLVYFIAKTKARQMMVFVR